MNFSLHPFKDLRGGDVVAYWYNAGGYGDVPKRHTGAVNKLLIFDTHVVVNKGPFGRVVNDDNFIELVRRRKS